MLNSVQREHATNFFLEALKAADPYAAVVRHVGVVKKFMQENDCHNILVVGCGKAAFAMAAAVETELKDYVYGGAIITKYGHVPNQSALHLIKVLVAAHPLPDTQGELATQEVLRLLRNTAQDTLVLCLISGGGSALMLAPADGITLAEKQIMTNLLLRAGATINELNTVRKHISAVKGGRLVEIASPAPIMALILSDVIDDQLEVIASGPTVPDSSTYAEALQVIRKYTLAAKIPASVIAHLLLGAQGQISETPKKENVIFGAVRNIVVGNNALAVDAAKRAAEKQGYTTHVLSTALCGEASIVAADLARRAILIKENLQNGETVCLIAGGETTVTVRGEGRGGRNTELALAFALQIKGIAGITCLSAGTDGIDGTGDNAGAVVDGYTITQAVASGLDAETYLRNNDSYNFFKDLNDGLVITGPTGTNVMDIQIILISKS